MSHADITVDGREYTYALGDDVAPGRRLGALVRGRATDELTGNPVGGPIVVRPAGSDLTRPWIAPLLTGHALAGGLVGVLGVPTQVLPNLAAQSYQLGLTATSRGYLPRSRVALHGPLPGPPPFPDAFAAADLGDLPLHREPIVLAGRTMVRNLAGQIVPAPSVPVRLASYWRLIANPMPAGTPNDLVAFWPPLAEALAPGAAVTHVALGPTGSPKILEVDAEPGTTELRLSNALNLGPNVVLGLEQDPLGPAPEREEYLRIIQVTGPADPTLPARVTLAAPTAFRHRHGTVVDVITVTPQPTLPTQLLWDTLRGDVTGALAAPASYLTGFFVGVSAGPPPVGYHRIARYEVVSDPVEGYFRLPPLHRLAQAQLDATYPGPPVVTRTIGPAYPAPEQRVDFLHFV